MDLAVKAFVSKGLPYLPDSNADRIRVVCAHLPGGFEDLVYVPSFLCELLIGYEIRAVNNERDVFKMQDILRRK